MNYSLQIIEQREVLGKDFKIYGDYENPLFLAKDVAEWIEHSNPTEMIRCVEENEKLNSTILSAGQKREVTFLTEDGLYEVLMQSRKPVAKQFKKEVKDVLRNIRKHGAYLTPDKLEEVLMNPDTLIKLATDLKIERQKRTALELETNKKDQLIGELKPKADYTDRILQNKSLVNANQIAKDYGMSAKSFNKTLFNLGVQYNQGGQWLLYSKHQGKGYTSSETFEFTHKNGMTDVKMRTKWTQKGRLFLYELLKKNNILPLIEQDSKIA